MTNRIHDSKGVPIYAGDLLRTPHFRDRNRRRKVYVYHIVVDNGGHLEAVPIREACGGRPDGGRFWLHVWQISAYWEISGETIGVEGMEVIDGKDIVGKDGRLISWYERRGDK